MLRLQVVVTGIVQGVGFRPFIFNLAKQYSLTGWVLNNAEGVVLEVQGEAGKVTDFVAAIRRQAPLLATVEAVTLSTIATIPEDTEFIIRESSGTTARTALVSPDVATCQACQREIAEPTDRRYNYPFTNCTNCGPRYTIIRDVPYDRQATTMADFIMCADCQREYDDPANRRFHAQPNACPVCGPHYRLLDRKGQEVATDAITRTRQVIREGGIVAIKGLGGYHLACNALDAVAVRTLRQRKIREDKPFAVMCGGLLAVRRLCQVSPEEEGLLTSSARPIVLLHKNENYNLPEEVAPGNPHLGVLLPYMPVQWLLLQPDDVWVMTSGNTSDEPIAHDDSDAQQRLADIADCFLIHNREIYRRADDSVVRVFRDKRYFIRRSRGYVPAPLALPQKLPSILAVGGEQKNTFCLTRGAAAFVSAHVGDLENLATYESYVENIEHYKKLFAIQPEAVAYDLHPEYLATKYALDLALPKVAVQHHHAHIAAVMAENGVEGSTIGVAFDGTGYGTDGCLWGGEFLVADFQDFVRVGHCRYMPLPGGAKAIREPWRMALWVLHEMYGKDLSHLSLPLVKALPQGWELTVQAAEKGINSPLSSGAGRLFDAAAALLGLRYSINYEGQAAVELELAASGYGQGDILPYSISQGSPYILDFLPTFAAIAERFAKGAEQGRLAAAFHTTLAVAVTTMVKRIASDTGIRQVALSGGVWQNITLLEQTVALLEQRGFTIYLHQQLPPNDGGLAYGQAVVAGMRLKNSVI